MKQTDLWNNSGAEFSPCGTYRYLLWRRWGKGETMTFIGLNPSTADADVDDPTIRKCRGFAMRCGYDAFHMLNLFAFRATSPKDMMAESDPVGPMNDRYLLDYFDATPIVAMWGKDGSHRGRDKEVQRLFTGRFHCFAKNKDGSPRHLLYVPYTASLMPYDIEEIGT